MSVDLLGLGQNIVASAVAGLERGGYVVHERARDLAPVRGATNPTRRVRFKTRAEVVADRESRRRLGLGREYIAAPRTRLTSRRGSNKAKIVIRPSGIRLASSSSESSGGALRDSITVTGVEGEGSHFSVMVATPMAYAKFQEFGTRHNPASPFLRPALHESRAEVVAGMRSAVRDAIRGKSVEIRVEE